MLIHVIRHTTPLIEEGICYGQTDLALAKSFNQEKDDVLNKIDNDYDIVITSPLQRCATLAEHIAAKTKTIEPTLMEYNFGDWEMQAWKDLKGEHYQNWMANFVDVQAPNGDSMKSMQKRVIDYWNSLITQPHSKVAIVTHSGVQRLIHAHILETPLEKMFRLQLDFGAVLEVTAHQEENFQTIKHL